MKKPVKKITKVKAKVLAKKPAKKLVAKSAKKAATPKVAKKVSTKKASPVRVKKSAAKPAAAKPSVAKPAVKAAGVQPATKVEIFACTFPTAIGDMAIAWRGDKLVGVFLPEEDSQKLLSRVRSRIHSSNLNWTSTPPSFVGHVAAQIRAHLRGEPQEFTVDNLEIPASGPFTRKVYECSLHIPSGTVLTYRELAEKAGSPKAFRAVGQAMATNPFPIVIPCHRVIGTSKSAGGFSAHGGLATKARILRIESHDKQV